MKLRTTRQEYRFEDASGYAVDVVAEETPGKGWGATVVMRTAGYVTAQDAIVALLYPAQAFIRQVREGVE